MAFSLKRNKNYKSTKKKNSAVSKVLKTNKKYQKTSLDVILEHLPLTAIFSSRRCA